MWYADDYRNSTEWVHQFSAEEIAELETAIQTAQASGKQTQVFASSGYSCLLTKGLLRTSSKHQCNLVTCILSNLITLILQSAVCLSLWALSSRSSRLKL